MNSIKHEHSCKIICIFCPRNLYIFANSVDPDGMQHRAVFLLGLYSLQNTQLGVQRPVHISHVLTLLKIKF